MKSSLFADVISHSRGTGENVVPFRRGMTPAAWDARAGKLFEMIYAAITDRKWEQYFALNWAYMELVGVYGFPSMVLRNESLDECFLALAELEDDCCAIPALIAWVDAWIDDHHEHDDSTWCVDRLGGLAAMLRSKRGRD